MSVSCYFNKYVHFMYAHISRQYRLQNIYDRGDAGRLNRLFWKPKANRRNFSKKSFVNRHKAMECRATCPQKCILNVVW